MTCPSPYSSRTFCQASSPDRAHISSRRPGSSPIQMKPTYGRSSSVIAAQLARSGGLSPRHPRCALLEGLLAEHAGSPERLPIGAAHAVASRQWCCARRIRRARLSVPRGWLWTERQQRGPRPLYGQSEVSLICDQSRDVSRRRRYVEHFRCGRSCGDARCVRGPAPTAKIRRVSNFAARRSSRCVGSIGSRAAVVPFWCQDVLARGVREPTARHRALQRRRSKHMQRSRWYALDILGKTASSTPSPTRSARADASRSTARLAGVEHLVIVGHGEDRDRHPGRLPATRHRAARRPSRGPLRHRRCRHDAARCRGLPRRSQRRAAVGGAPLRDGPRRATGRGRRRGAAASWSSTIIPAERCAQPEPVSTLDGRAVLVTEYVEGKPAASTKALRRKLGELLGPHPHDADRGRPGSTPGRIAASPARLRRSARAGSRGGGRVALADLEGRVDPSHREGVRLAPGVARLRRWRRRSPPRASCTPTQRDGNVIADVRRARARRLDRGRHRPAPRVPRGLVAGKRQARRTSRTCSPATAPTWN